MLDLVGGNVTPWDDNVLRYSSESHREHGLSGTAAFNAISTQVWAMQIVWGWNKDLNPTFLNHSNDGGVHAWTGARSSIVCLRAGEGVPLSAAVALGRPSLAVVVLFATSVVGLMSYM